MTLSNSVFSCFFVSLALTLLAPLASAQNVAILYADQEPRHVDDIVDNVDRTGVVTGSISTIDVGTATPTLSQLQAYHAVLVHIAEFFHDATALGNVLADYVDAGGGVVVCMNTNHTPQALLGRFNDEDYHPFTYEVHGIGMPVIRELGTPAQPNHPVLDGVTVLSVNSTPLPSSLRPSSTMIVPFNTGEQLAAENDNHAGPVIAFNFFAVSDANYGSGYHDTTDGARMLANALNYAGGSPGAFFIATNTGLTLDRGASHTITSGELEAYDGGATAPQDIEFTLVVEPITGTLRLAGNALQSTDTFTQADIDNGDLTYEHNASKTYSDTFTVDVTNGIDTLTDESISIQIDPAGAIVLHVPGSQSASVGSTSFTVEGISIDYIEVTLEVTLDVSLGTVAVEPTPGVMITGDNPGASLQLSGPHSALENLLAAGVTLSVVSGTIDTVTLEVSAEEPGETSDSGVVAVEFNAVSIGSSGSGGCGATSTKANRFAVAWLVAMLVLFGLVRRRI